jgi:hypothetical protein
MRESQRLYLIYRRYIMDEANLINARLTWLLTIQGFLFASYGLIASSERPWFHEALNVMRYLSVFGMAVSVVAFVSIRAARLAANSLCKQWDGLAHTEKFKKRMPSIRGGGHRQAHFLGYAAPVFIPWMLCAIWVVLLILSFGVGEPSEPGVNV